MSFRKVLFWVHLVAGVISGLSIGIMCFTGTMLAFEKELVAWSERDARRVEVPAGATRLTLDQMQAKLREAQPDFRPASIVIQNDPAAAVAFSAGRSGGVYVNPYTGEVREPASKSMGAFMQKMVELHRYLGFSGEDSRPRGKLINGVCNIAFFVLAVTGLYLWMPRSWSWRALRPVIWFRQNTSSKARDFNWHNAIGFWTAPILIVLTLTAIPISFRWGGTLIYTLTGTEQLAAGAAGPGAAAGPAVEVPTPAVGAKPLSQDALFTAAQTALPKWQTMTYRSASAGGRGGPGGAGGPGARGAATAPGSSTVTPADAQATKAPSATAEAQPARKGGREGGRGPGGEGGRAPGGEMRGEGRGGASAAPQAFTLTVREAGTWPRTASTTLALDPFTGTVLRRTGYADMNAAQQVRSWTRFLHTGEAVGPLGQFLAGLSCLGGVFLVYTGFALSWRRFFGKKSKAPSPRNVEAAVAASR